MRVLSQPGMGFENPREKRSVDGFNLHASAAISAEDRVGLEQLLAWVFGFDVLSCPRCESRMQLISFISERKAIVDILESLQMATAPPEVARACRIARQDEFSFA
ncbi:MAG: hypothetical protein WCK49_09815 [Myxococcaceae bacterium]